jgi:cytochrome c556
MLRYPLVVSITSLLACLVIAGCDKSPEAPADAAPKASAEEARADDQPAPQQKEEPAGPPKTLDDLPEDVNAVQHEMQLLNSSMQQILTLIANDELEGVPAQIKKVHPARQLTMTAVEKGAYEPPRNADKMEEFTELDDQFHDDLKGLIAASKNDDLQAATDSYTDLVQGCTECHSKFRFAPGEGPAPGDGD